MSGTATMYWMQWSRSAGLFSGPCLSMMRIAAACVRIVICSMSSTVLPALAMALCSVMAASAAVCAWNSAGKLILNSTFSITYVPYLRWNLNGRPLKDTS